MPSRIALITFMDSGPVDPGYGVQPPVHIGGGPAYGGGYPSTGPIYGGGHPSGGFPVAPGHPSGGFPIAGHPGGGPVYPPGHPSQGLPVTPVYPSNELPSAPVDPAWGYSPHLGWFVVYCAGGPSIDNELPEGATPK